LTLPAADERWLEGFCVGFFSLARAHDVTLIGGDTTAGPLTITVQIMGHVPSGKALRRGGAQLGDLIFVSGHVGDAAAGLALIEKRAETSNEAHRDYLTERFLRPVPRIGLGRALRGLASAMIDVSDGLGADLGHILEASGVGARLDTARLPMSGALTATFEPKRALELALGGGDDYELCFTLAPRHEHLIPGIESAAGCALSRIGVIDSRPGLALQDGTAVSQSVHGFDHFSR
jgi:thiamine-monophosphate kinase